MELRAILRRNTLNILPQDIVKIQAIGQGHIVGTEVTMRNGQAREADPIGVFKNGESVEILKFVDTPNGEQWVKVRRNNGDKGFVFSRYLRKD